MNDQQLINITQQVGKWLLQKAQGTISEADEALLNDWLEKRDPTDRQFFDRMMDWDNIDAVLRYLYDIDEDAALTDVTNRIAAHSIEAVPVVPVSRINNRKRFYKYAAAAVVTGVLVTAVWFFAKNDTQKTQAPVAKLQDVQPGGDKAVLTLADGRKVVLDNVQNGAISHEGNTAVSKQDGVVMYQSATDAGNKPVTGYNTLATPRGGQYQLVLPDGSKVWLNAASSIKYPTSFTGNERRVEITGEAYFEVAHDAAKPFYVNKGNTEVKVLGTHFNVNTYDDEDAARITLLEGRVEVKSEAGSQASVTITPGKQAVSTPDSRFTIHDADVEQVTAWKNGLFQFEDASIESIMRQVARWYDIQVVYKGKIEKQFVGKIPRKVPVSSLLNILEATGWVHFTIEGKTITVAP